MKKLNYLSSLTIAAILLGGCGGIKKMEQNVGEVNYSVTPAPLEMHADKVEISVSGTYPEKYFNKKAILTVTPYLVDMDGNELATFESVTVQGEKVEDNYPVVKNEGGSLPSYTASVDYSENMLRSQLKFKLEAKIAGKDPLPAFDYPNPVAEGIIATPALLQVTPKAILMPDKFQRVVAEKVEADIHYVINRAEVRSTELRKDDVSELSSTLKDTKDNERKKVKKAKISAYASPDGPIDLNERLSKNRQNSALRYMKQELRKAKIEPGSDEEFFSLLVTPEDWEGFKELMQQSDVQDKELILRVLSMYEDPQVREREIKNISQAFEEIKVKILPELRRSKLIVDLEVIGYSDEELKSMIDSAPDTLNVEEVLYTASLFEDLDKKLSIYKVAANNFPEDVRGQNNIGYVELLKGNKDAAKEAFDKASELEENDIVKNNLGVIALLENDLEKAEELFTSAMGAGDAVNYNLGIISVKQAEYDQAVNYFGNISDFNAALAKLLDGQSEGAMSTLNAIEEADAMDYYLMAVTSARQQKQDLVFSNLRSAISNDPSLKDRAKKDIEFISYFEEETFKSIVN